MTEEYTEIDILLAKQLAGEATPDELLAVNEWLDASRENQAYFEGLERIWATASELRTGPSWEVDTETALQKVKVKMQQNRAIKRTLFSNRVWLQLAATLALVATAVWFFSDPAPLPQPNIASSNTTLTETLTDGSVVVLNRNSGLRIADNYNRKERRMRLSGEAYFKVTPDAKRPFVVETDQLEIKVVGTEFNVDNKPGSSLVTVSVTSGKVQLKSAVQTELLTAGEQAEYNHSSGRITRITQPDPNVLAYKNRVFTFDETPLGTVLKQLNNVYGVNIRLENKALADCPLNTRFDNIELDQIIEIIAESFSLSVRRDGGEIVLDGASCFE